VQVDEGRVQIRGRAGTGVQEARATWAAQELPPGGRQEVATDVTHVVEMRHIAAAGGVRPPFVHSVVDVGVHDGSL
jgi:hypothetical protein